MAKPRAPLLSFGASGSIADTLTYASWRGVNYVREKVIPENPRSAAQTQTRSLFGWLSDLWKLYPALAQSPWDAYASGRKFTNRNALIGQNVNAMRGDVDLANMVFSPGARGGLAPESMSSAAGVALITVTITPPAAPPNWTLQAVVAACVKDQDPQTASLMVTVAAEDAAAPMDTVILTGLDTVLYRVGAWTRWLKPDGRIAYGASLTDTATPT